MRSDAGRWPNGEKPRHDFDAASLRNFLVLFDIGSYMNKFEVVLISLNVLTRHMISGSEVEPLTMVELCVNFVPTFSLFLNNS